MRPLIFSASLFFFVILLGWGCGSDHSPSLKDPHNPPPPRPDSNLGMPDTATLHQAYLDRLRLGDTLLWSSQRLDSLLPNSIVGFSLDPLEEDQGGGNPTFSLARRKFYDGQDQPLEIILADYAKFLEPLEAFVLKKRLIGKKGDPNLSERHLNPSDLPANISSTGYFSSRKMGKIKEAELHLCIQNRWLLSLKMEGEDGERVLFSVLESISLEKLK